jgi:hypothetical protein
VAAEAEWFASLKTPAAPWIKVIEQSTVPKTYLGQGRMRFIDPDDKAAEPIGNRIIMLPMDVKKARLRDPRPGAGFNALVPAGSVAKGKALLVPRIFAAMGLRRALSIIRRLAALPKVTSMAAAPFYTAVPIRFGETAAKLALFPDAAQGPRAASLREDLAARLAKGPLSWTMRAQFFADETTTPIEDASVEWRTPFVDLARLVLPQQELRPEIEQLVEKLSFNPWHAVEELRPLGAMMRARAPAYRESVIERQAAQEPEELIAP